MITITCDRCGKSINSCYMSISSLLSENQNIAKADSGIAYKVGRILDDDLYETLNLCKDCQNDLDDFMTNNPNSYYHKYKPQ